MGDDTYARMNEYESGLKSLGEKVEALQHAIFGRSSPDQTGWVDGILQTVADLKAGQKMTRNQNWAIIALLAIIAYRVDPTLINGLKTVLHL